MTEHEPTPVEQDDPTPAGIGRRGFIATTGLGAAAVALGAGATAVTPSPSAAAEPAGASTLRFRSDGTFRIVQFNDTQDDELTDRRTVQLMAEVLEDQRPDLVVMNGDNITGGCADETEMRQAMNNIVQPMEQRGVPWVLTYGNHDEDSTPQGGLDEEDMLGIYRSYEHNLNEPSAKGVTGTGNMALTIAGSRSRRRAAFALYLLDSGRYAPSRIADQDLEGYPHWDWLRMDQVGWYTRTSQDIQRRAGGRTVPALMFIHIPLWEYRFMWFGGVDERNGGNHELAVQRHGIVGERNEDECPGPFNSGMFSAILHRGDVRGVFCGHDHVNTYVGNYYGVQLGYAGNTGFGTYGLPGADRNRLRGARVFDLTETQDDVTVDTRMVWASDYGIDLTADDQPMTPLPLPRRR